MRQAVTLDPRNLQARTALIQEIEDAGTANALAEAARLAEELATSEPDNVAVAVERARLAAKRRDTSALADAVARLDRFASTWPPDVVDQYRKLQQASASADAGAAAREIVVLRNVLVEVPAFVDGRRRITPSAELVADPLIRFLRLPAPASTPAPPDDSLTFSAQPMFWPGAGKVTDARAIPLDGAQNPEVVAVDAATAGLASRTVSPLLEKQGPASRTSSVLLPIDWNHDFLIDVVTGGPDGVRLFLQGDRGSFSDATADASKRAAAGSMDVTGLWAADIEMDGDVDIVVGVRGEPPVVLRNNGDGTWQPIRPFAGVTGIRQFVWGDLDRDGDPDAAMVDDRGSLAVFANLQSGAFQQLPARQRVRSDHARHQRHARDRRSHGRRMERTRLDIVARGRGDRPGAAARRGLRQQRHS